MTGCLDHAQGHGLDADDERRVVADDGLHSGEALVKHTQRVGLFEVNTARASGFLESVHVDGPVVVVGDGSNFNFCTLTVIVHDRQFVGRRER